MAKIIRTAQICISEPLTADDIGAFLDGVPGGAKIQAFQNATHAPGGTPNTELSLRAEWNEE